MAKPSTGQLRDTSSSLGRSAGASDNSALIPAHATSSPAPQPAVSNTNASAMNWRIRRVTSGAERMSNRQLASSGGGLREEQIRDVRARDEQQEQDGTEQHVERRAHAAGEEGLEGDGGGVRHQVIALLVGVANDVSSDRAEVRVRLRSAHTLAHPAQGREVVRRSVAVHWIELRRYPQFDSRRKLKSGGHHADDRVTAILDAERERREPRRRPEILRPVPHGSRRRSVRRRHGDRPP